MTGPSGSGSLRSYDTVARLAERGFIEPVEVNREGRRPERTVYAITEPGGMSCSRGCGTWRASLPAEYPEFAAPLMFIYSLGLDRTIAALQQRAARLEAEISSNDAFRRAFLADMPQLPADLRHRGRVRAGHAAGGTRLGTRHRSRSCGTARSRGRRTDDLKEAGFDELTGARENGLRGGNPGDRGIHERTANPATRGLGIFEDMPAAARDVHGNARTELLACPHHQCPRSRSTGLRKSFRVAGKAIEAVRGIDLTVAAGEIFGCSGRTARGRRRPCASSPRCCPPTPETPTSPGRTSGTLPGASGGAIGYVGQLGGADRDATGRENLHAAPPACTGSSAAGAKERCAELGGGLRPRTCSPTGRSAPTRAASAAGSRSRSASSTARACCSSTSPRPALTRRTGPNLWEQLRLLREGGTTIFLTTHYLDEADQLGDRVAIVDHGRVIALGRPDELKQRYSADTIAVTPEAGPDVLARRRPRARGRPVHHECRGGAGGRGPGDDPAHGHRRHPRHGRGLRRARVARRPDARRVGRPADA